MGSSFTSTYSHIQRPQRCSVGEFISSLQKCFLLSPTLSLVCHAMPPSIGCVESKPPKLTKLSHECSPNLGCGQYTSILYLPSDVFKTEKVLNFVLYSSKLLKKNSRDF